MLKNLRSLANFDDFFELPGNVNQTSFECPVWQSLLLIGAMSITHQTASIIRANDLRDYLATTGGGVEKVGDIMLIKLFRTTCSPKVTLASFTFNNLHIEVFAVKLHWFTLNFTMSEMLTNNFQFFSTSITKTLFTFKFIDLVHLW